VFSRQIFDKCSSLKFHENPSRGSRVVTCGWTDGHDKANSGFCNFVKVPKKAVPLQRAREIQETWFQNLNMRNHLEDQSVDEGILLTPVFMTGSEIVDCVRPSITVCIRAPPVSVLRQKSPRYI